MEKAPPISEINFYLLFVSIWYNLTQPVSVSKSQREVKKYEVIVFPKSEGKMTEGKAKEILDKVLSYTKADNTEVSLSGNENASTRFSNNVITQNIAKSDLGLHVRGAWDSKVGSASTNKLDEESLRDVVARSEMIARLSEPDPEYMPPLEPQTYREVKSYFNQTAKFTPAARAETIKKSIDQCAKENLRAAGSFSNGSSFSAVANSKGLFAYHKSSSGKFSNTVITDDSSGKAESSSRDINKVDSHGTTEIAMQKAKASRNPKEISPEKYTVVLEPTAVRDILSYMTYSMDAKAAHEGRNAFHDKENQMIGAENITIRSQPDHPDCPTRPFLGDGMPAPEVTWIENGVVKNLAYSRYWAKETGHSVTGSPTNFIMKGGENTLENLINSVDEGILVTRFWYIRFVDPMKLLLTGMTRDGLFWIENGEIKYGIKNMRFNESPFNILKNVQMLGHQEQTSLSTLVPSLKVSDFTFSSGTKF